MKITGRGPLAGVKVIEAATFMSGPYATMQLAELGAEVIKVEPPTGDPFRSFGRPPTYVSAPWASMNRGKKSVVLDLKDPTEHRAFLDLLSDADVLVTNWRAGAAEKLGLTYEGLAAANPRLIWCAVTGFGESGPAAGESAFDMAIQARSGLMDAMGSEAGPAVVPGYPMDKATALLATQAVLAALYQRTQTGRGDRIDLAMLDVAAAVNFPDLFVNRVFLEHEPASARNAHSRALRALRASDGWLMVAPGNGKQMRAACIAAGHPEWIDTIMTIPVQAALIDELYRSLAEVVADATVEHWVGTFRSHDVACAPCLTMDEHLADPQVANNGIYRVANWDGAGPSRYPRYPAIFESCGPLWADAPPPTLPSAR